MWISNPNIWPLRSLANEVLIYIILETGYNYNKDTDIEVAVWTNDGEVEYKKYLYGHLYQQRAWSYNSENMFFPCSDI